MPKKYVLYPGVGRVRSLDESERYIPGKMLAACYSVPYSECIDTDNPAIRLVASKGAKFDELVPLLPNMFGVYRLPSREERKIIVVEGLHEAVKKSG